VTDVSEDVVLLALASAHPSRLLTEELGQKAGKMGSVQAKQVLGGLLLKGLIDGSDTAGFLITSKGMEFVHDNFVEGKIGDYQTFAPRNPVEPKINLRAWISAILVGLLLLVGILLLSACATAPVLHTEAQLNDVGTRCGFALGELFQDESEKRLLLVVRNRPTPQQRVCVARWARANHLKAVFVHVDYPT
jgi:hypothetical protein